MEVEYTGTAPRYMSDGAAGADLPAKGNYTILVGEQIMIDTGVRVSIPEGYYGLLCPRSSLCNKKGLSLVNSVGVIDSDFRGSIRMVYKNTGEHTVIINDKDRIGQIIISPYVKATFVEVEALEDTVRGCGMYGSTDNL